MLSRGSSFILLLVLNFQVPPYLSYKFSNREPTCGLMLGPYGIPGDTMECGPMGELMTEKGVARPFMEDPSVLMGECRDPEGPMEDGLSK